MLSRYASLILESLLSQPTLILVALDKLRTAWGDYRGGSEEPEATSVRRAAARQLDYSVWNVPELGAVEIQYAIYDSGLRTITLFDHQASEVLASFAVEPVPARVGKIQE